MTAKKKDNDSSAAGSSGSSGSTGPTSASSGSGGLKKGGPKKIVILGSTGSIGRSTLQVVDDHPGSFQILALATNSDVERLCEQAEKYKPAFVYVGDEKAAEFLRGEPLAERFTVLTGKDGLIELATLPEAELIVNALVGSVGLLASLAAVEKGKTLALANKESLVVGGPLFDEAARKSGAKILPIDSEHSAIWQCMACGRDSEVRRLILTASGGPFRSLGREEIQNVTREEALNHPTWKMGPKVTIDSATLMNKGLELIEAVWLFSIPPEMISIVVHPQSIVHSMVEFVDSSVMAQMSAPDMKLPISYALFWPERAQSSYGLLDLTEISSLTFTKPDPERFPAINLAYNVALQGGTAPTALNAANEVAVEAFLLGKISFPKITEIIEETVKRLDLVAKPTLLDILETDQWGRKVASEML